MGALDFRIPVVNDNDREYIVIMFLNTPLRLSAQPNGKTSRGFTLVELLVVISIIAVLMGLLFPVAGSVMRSAKKTQAKNDALQIASAIKGYYTEYGRFPIDPEETDVALDETQLSELYQVLLGVDTTVTQERNPRLIVFLDAKDAKPAATDYNAGARTPKGGISQDYIFTDPWGQAYEVVIDADYNNNLSVLPDPFQANPSRPLRDTVAVASPGDPEQGRDGQDQESLERKAVASWR